MDELRKHPELGRILKQLRKARRLKQADVSAAVWGDSSKWNWYSKIENRANAYPSDEELDQILGVLGTSRESVAAMAAHETWSDEVLAAAPPGAAASPAPPPSADAELRRELSELAARLSGDYLREALLDARTWLARQELAEERSR
jgi:hypothetical protein